MDTTTRTIRTVGPEDLQRGQYIIVTSTVDQWDSVLLYTEQGAERTEPRSTLWRNAYPTPLRVVELCLPYVLVKEPDGTHKLLDLHRDRVARLDGTFGRAATKRLKPKQDKKERMGRCKKCKHQKKSGKKGHKKNRKKGRKNKKQ